MSASTGRDGAGHEGSNPQTVASLELEIPAWNQIRVIRTSLAEALAGYPKEVQSAAIMAACELVENALKYGESEGNIKFTLAAEADQMTIEVTQKMTHASDAEPLRERLLRISQAENKEQLYFARLQQLMTDPTQSGGLGLCRIAFEGGFDLTCNWTQQMLTVAAVRRV